MHAVEVYGIYEYGPWPFAWFEGTKDLLLAQGGGSVEACPGKDGLERNLRVAAVNALEFFCHGQYVVGRKAVRPYGYAYSHAHEHGQVGHGPVDENV